MANHRYLIKTDALVLIENYEFQLNIKIFQFCFHTVVFPFYDDSSLKVCTVTAYLKHLPQQ